MAKIFVSYAHVDNQSILNQQPGWVSQLVQHIEAEVTRQMGRTEYYELWKDHRLDGNDAVTPEIEKQLRESHALVIMFSHGWLESPWCQKELDYFKAHHGDISGRVFVVEQQAFPQDEKPELMQELLNYPFWQKNHQGKVRQLGYPVAKIDDEAYFESAVDLAKNIADCLKQAVSSNNTISLPEPEATVYVAPVPDSLYAQRNQLISALGQYGIDALPRINKQEADMDATLAQCSHFVQLLDENWSMGAPHDQHFIAETVDIPILQWRDQNLDYSNAKEEEQIKLLEGEKVIASSLPDFIRMVYETVLPKLEPQDEPPPTQHNGDQLVFVHAGQEDLPRAEQVAADLEKKGFGIALPRYSGDASRIRKSIERGYEFCDVLLMMHQKASVDVVEDFLAEARVKTLQREQKPAMLICQCHQAERLSFVPPGISKLACKDDFDADCLEQFLAEMEEAAV